MVWQDIPQIPFQINMQDDNWLEQLRQNKQAENLFNQYDDDTLKRNILNGLNMGSKYVADMQSLNNINIPKTNEEIESARAGNFNTLGNALSGNVQAQPNNWQRFVMGYQDNYENSFNPNNLSRGTNKNWANRLGEGLGTVGRFIDSPLGRGLMAAGLNKALGYDNSLQEGLQAYAGRQNAVTADKLYRNQLKQYGYTDDDLRQIRGNITSDMYKNLATNLYRTRNLDQNTYIKLKKAYDNQLQMGILSPEQYQANVEALNNQYVNSQVQTMQAGNVGLSNQTRNTNSQIEYRDKRLEQYDKQLELIDKRIAQSANNSDARLELAKEKLKIQQEKDNYKKQKKQEFNNDLAYYSKLSPKEKQVAQDYMIKTWGKDFLAASSNL